MGQQTVQAKEVYSKPWQKAHVLPHPSSHLHILHIFFQTQQISPELMQVFANGKRCFHSFIEFYMIQLKHQEVKIWS